MTIVLEFNYYIHSYSIRVLLKMLCNQYYLFGLIILYNIFKILKKSPKFNAVGLCMEYINFIAEILYICAGLHGFSKADFLYILLKLRKTE